MMPRTIYLGRLMGLYCLFIATAMMWHKQTTVEVMTALVHNAPVLFLASLLALVAGLAVVLAHKARCRSSSRLSVGSRLLKG
jgi:hypothetical protein